VLDAYERVREHVTKTPVVTCDYVNKLLGAEQVFFKCENLQKTGSFKVRGALNLMATLTEEQRKRGVIAFSSGNHALGVAMAS